MPRRNGESLKAWPCCRRSGVSTGKPQGRLCPRWASRTTSGQSDNPCRPMGKTLRAGLLALPELQRHLGLVEVVDFLALEIVVVVELLAVDRVEDRIEVDRLDRVIVAIGRLHRTA